MPPRRAMFHLEVMRPMPHNIIPQKVGANRYLVSAIQQTSNLARRFDPYAIIAGGAVRDLVFKKPVNDIDVYLNSGVDYPQHVLVDLAKRLGFIDVAEPHLNANGYGWNPRINCVINCAIYGIPQYPVQLVFLNKYASTFQEVAQFNVNISQLWMSIEDFQRPVIHCGPGIRQFMQDNIVRPVRSIDGLENHDAYIAKIKAKYWDFPWGDPAPLLRKEIYEQH